MTFPECQLATVQMLAVLFEPQSPAARTPSTPTHCQSPLSAMPSSARGLKLFSCCFNAYRIVCPIAYSLNEFIIPDSLMDYVIISSILWTSEETVYRGLYILQFIWQSQEQCHGIQYELYFCHFPRCGAASIAASLSGATSVTANDVDESAAAAAEDNADLNGARIGVCQNDRLRGDMWVWIFADCYLRRRRQLFIDYWPDRIQFRVGKFKWCMVALHLIVYPAYEFTILDSNMEHLFSLHLICYIIYD